MTSLRMYWHTLRHLKPIQLYGRVWHCLHKPTVNLQPAPSVRLMHGNWCLPAKRRQSLFESFTFCFLNEEHSLSEIGWDAPQIDKLWRYNQHYFDDLNAENAETRVEWHQDLLSLWIVANPPTRGTGWEPYPVSLRIVNWIKWALGGNSLRDELLQSLAIQVRWLVKRLEFHLQGNHLFANAKALVFAGIFFEGKEAERWLRTGLGILEQQIPEQILADGGQFERSTMYHALALEDMLDLYNLFNAYQTADVPHYCWMDKLPHTILKMRYWLQVMSHPDGRFSFFNDAATGIAPETAEIEAYADKLFLPTVAGSPDGVTHLAESGYIRVQLSNAVMLIDVGPVGPDYLPGHAHADTLSFELSIFGQRVFVNSGISCYGNSSERRRQRSTAAHNTVEINGLNSSEVWDGFRVARRAYPGKVFITEKDGITIESSHNGYRWLPGRPKHTRKWVFFNDIIVVTDTIDGAYNSAASHLLLHPAVDVKRITAVDEMATVALKLTCGNMVTVTSQGGILSRIPSTWHPEFGSVCATSRFVMQFKNSGLHTKICWGDSA